MEEEKYISEIRRLLDVDAPAKIKMMAIKEVSSECLWQGQKMEEAKMKKLIDFGSLPAAQS